MAEQDPGVMRWSSHLAEADECAALTPGTHRAAAVGRSDPAHHLARVHHLPPGPLHQPDGPSGTPTCTGIAQHRQGDPSGENVARPSNAATQPITLMP